MSVPAIIHTLWLQGTAHAPEIVQVCFARWRKLNPGHELKIYNASDVESLLGKNFQLSAFSHQALSDIFRARVLLEHGGIWADATVYPVKPLDQWLPAATSKTQFFAFAKPGPDRPISSWFLAASPQHPVMQAWWQEIVRFWSSPRTLTQYPGGTIPPDPVQTVSPQGNTPGLYPYFWFHYLFAYCLESNPGFKKIWDESEHISAEPEHALQNLMRSTPNPTKDQFLQAIDSAPVQKLDWRLNFNLPAGTP